MSRLTKKDEGSDFYHYPKCIEMCNGEGCSEKCNYCPIEESIIDKLGAYEDAEEQGLLLRLPCKVGTQVYLIVNKSEIVETEILSYETHSDGVVYANVDLGYAINMKKLLGVTVFLTKEKAEQKLAEMKGGIACLQI